jgi:Ni,Fe-hydrogenase I small subunit
MPKVKEKTNKNIIEIPGCPPNLYESLNLIHKYYGKSQTPNLSFYNNLIKTYYEQATKPKIKTGN